jgi:OmpA family
MSEPSTLRVSGREDVSNQTPNAQLNEAAQMRELQKLLFGADQQSKLDRLDSEWNDPGQLAPRVGQALPDAIAFHTSDSQLTEAIGPYVIESIKNASRRNPDSIATAIFPILGPAIRKAIAQAFSSLTQTINQTLQHSFTIQGLKWRMEAMATGKSFAEVVLFHSLLYRVEQVFLIHSQTGIVLNHVTADYIENAQDADLVSGTLTAIQDFIKDSFGATAGDDVQTFQVGDLTILAERGPRAVLACAVRGTVATEIREEMQKTLEQIHSERSAQLEDFEGDTIYFDICRPLLADHLESRYQQSSSDNSETSGIPKPAIIVGSILFILLGLLTFFTIRDRMRWNHFLSQLKATPGIVLTETYRGWNSYQVNGLRDSLSVNPEELMKQSQLNPEKLIAHWELYQSLAPQFVIERANKLLHPPSGVKLSLENNILYATGNVPSVWLNDAQKIAPAISGIDGFQIKSSDTIESLQKEIESSIILCVGAKPASNQIGTIESIGQKIVQLDLLAKNNGKFISVIINGHTDSSGTLEKNKSLSLVRASKVESLIIKQTGALSNSKISKNGVWDQENSSGDEIQNRRVTIKINIQ